MTPDSDGDRGQGKGDQLLRALLELDAFRVCPPLETDGFLRLCKNNGLAVTEELLEQFEKKGLFYPLLRVQFPVRREKLRLLADGQVQGCGTLEGEVWDGPIDETYVWPDFSYHDLRRWMDESLLYSPETQPIGPQIPGTYLAPWRGGFGGHFGSHQARVERDDRRAVRP